MTREDFPPLTRWQRVRRWVKRLLFRDLFASRIVLVQMQLTTSGDPEWDGQKRTLQWGEAARYSYELADCLLDESVRPDGETRRRRTKKPRMACAIPETTKGASDGPST